MNNYAFWAVAELLKFSKLFYLPLAVPFPGFLVFGMDMKFEKLKLAFSERE